MNSSVKCLGCLGSLIYGPPVSCAPPGTVHISVANPDCARLVEDLEDASSRGILKKRLKYYAHSRLLIIDELGYLDVGSAGADLLFQLISTRYEQRSTIIATNVGISGWGRVFGDDVAASAIADRVCHHCHLVKITGRSYRLKDLPRDGPVKP